MKRITATLTPLFLTLVFFQPLFAQGQGMDGEGRKRVEELRRVKMVEALNLTEEQAVRLTVRERDFRQGERELMEQRRKLITHLDEASKSGTDQEIEKLIGQIQQTTVEITNRRAEYLSSLKDVLSVKQLGQLVVFEDRFMHELRLTLRDANKRRMQMHKKP